MKLEEFNYDLPKELIAQEPAEPRDSCRLMMVDKKTGEWEHHHFRDILDEIREGDVFVFNNTKVIPARLYGKKKESKASSISHNTPVGRILPAQLISRPPIWASE